MATVALNVQADLFTRGQRVTVTRQIGPTVPGIVAYRYTSITGDSDQVYAVTCVHQDGTPDDVKSTMLTVAGDMVARP